MNICVYTCVYEYICTCVYECVCTRVYLYDFFVDYGQYIHQFAIPIPIYVHGSLEDITKQLRSLRILVLCILFLPAYFCSPEHNNYGLISLFCLVVAYHLLDSFFIAIFFQDFLCLHNLVCAPFVIILQCIPFYVFSPDCNSKTYSCYNQHVVTLHMICIYLSEGAHYEIVLNDGSLLFIQLCADN